MEEETLYLDPAQPVAARVADLLARMTLEEKVGQMCQYLLPPEEALHAEGDGAPSGDGAPPGGGDDSTMHYSAERRASVPALIAQGLIGSLLSESDPERLNEAQSLAASSRLGIPLLLGIDAIHGHAMRAGATVFPAPIGLAATWDTALASRVAQATARELRANNLHWSFSPNVDVLRDGRWGRSGETFGEDPYLVGRMGAAMVQGYQGDLSDPDAHVLACAKHYIAGGEPSNGLNFAAMDMSERALREVFLPPFAAAVAAGVETVMAAHNEVNGVPCHANAYLLTEVLREELGFAGFVVSDWTDVARIYSLHRIAASVAEADRLAVEAGIDMHMHGPGFLEPVVALVRAGRLDEARIDAAVRKILAAKFTLGLFERRYVDVEAARAALATPAHRELALEAARKSLVLLKNDDLLPLAPDVGRIFVTGPNADNQALLGDWVVAQPEENVTTVVEGLRAQAAPGSPVDYFDCGGLLEIDHQAIEEAARRATYAEVAIVVVGENPLRYQADKTEGENIARPSLALPGRQLELVQAVAASGTPTVVVLVNGRPQAIPWIAANVRAVVEAFHPGMRGGQAIAEVLFGAVNPGGRLPFTVPPDVGYLRMVYNHRPSDYFRAYTLGVQSPLYPFGYGLSYTTFAYSELAVPETVAAGEAVPVRVTVENTGARAGDEVVIVYMRDSYASVTRPVKEVVAFARVTLEPGERRAVAFTLAPEQLALYNARMERVVEPGVFEVYVGDQVAAFTVQG